MHPPRRAHRPRPSHPRARSEDTSKHSLFQDLSFRLPILREQEQQGYMCGAELKVDYDGLRSSIHMQVPAVAGVSWVAKGANDHMAATAPLRP